MGAIVTRLIEGIPDPEAMPFPAHTEDKNEVMANRAYVESVRTIFRKLYKELLQDGYAVPTDPHETITRGALEDFLRTSLGEEVKLELTIDPAGMGYADKSDEEVAELINEPYDRLGRVVEGTEKMTIAEVVDARTFVLALEKDGTPADFKAFGGNLRNKKLKFSVETPTLDLASTEGVIESTKKSTLVLVKAPDVTAHPGDIVTIIDTEGGTHIPRIAALSQRFPFAPNALSAEDIASVRK